MPLDFLPYTRFDYISCPFAQAIPQAIGSAVSLRIAKITTVQMAVAKLELIFSTPTLAKMVVNAAKKAESRVKIHQAFSLAMLVKPQNYSYVTD
jgi:hypothetical protein